MVNFRGNMVHTITNPNALMMINLRNQVIPDKRSYKLMLHGMVGDLNWTKHLLIAYKKKTCIMGDDSVLCLTTICS